jgi:hypothetical protein
MPERSSASARRGTGTPVQELGRFTGDHAPGIALAPAHFGTGGLWVESKGFRQER